MVMLVARGRRLGGLRLVYYEVQTISTSVILMDYPLIPMHKG